MRQNLLAKTTPPSPLHQNQTPIALACVAATAQFSFFGQRLVEGRRVFVHWSFSAIAAALSDCAGNRSNSPSYCFGTRQRKGFRSRRVQFALTYGQVTCDAGFGQGSG